jgi:glycosyltransferase involved in cell wall biosynthesis
MISIVIPAFNEEQILKQSMERLSDWFKLRREPFEVIVVENGSTDRTWETSQQLLKEYRWLQVIQIPEKSVGKAFAAGVRKAQYQNIISLDCDLSTDLNFIHFAESLLKYSSMVVGSKTLGEQKRSLLRIFGSQTYLLFTQVLFQITLTDFSMGAKAYKRDVILPILDSIDSWTAYVFEICVWLTIQKKIILQVGVTCIDNRPSRFNLLHEGFYRYANLFKVKKRVQDPTSWFQTIKAPEVEESAGTPV